MTNSQKKLVLIFIVIVAWLAHSQFCEWKWSFDGSHGDMLMLGDISLDADVPYNHRPLPILLYVVLGLFLPIALLAMAGYLWLGWFPRKAKHDSSPTPSPSRDVVE